MLYDPTKLKAVEEQSSCDEDNPPTTAPSTTISKQQNNNKLTSLPSTKIPATINATEVTPTKSPIEDDTRRTTKSSSHGMDGFIPPTDNANLCHHPKHEADTAVDEPNAKRLKSEERQDDRPHGILPAERPLPELHPIPIVAYASNDNYGQTVNVMALGGTILGNRYAAVTVQQGINSGYMTPIKKNMHLHPDDAVKQFRIVGVVFACEEGHPERVKKADPNDNRFFPFPCYLIVRHEGESLEDLQIDLVTRFNHYATTHRGSGDEEFLHLPQFCRGSIENKPELPWNHYIQNKSVCAFIRQTYRKDSRQDLMLHGDIMTTFFGSVDEGIRQLTKMSDSQWSRLILK